MSPLDLGPVGIADLWRLHIAIPSEISRAVAVGSVPTIPADINSMLNSCVAPGTAEIANLQEEQSPFAVHPFLFNKQSVNQD